MTSTPDYSALFRASPYPYLLIDTASVIIGANPAYLHATGRTALDIVGKHIFDAFPSNAADPDLTNQWEVQMSIALAMSTGQPHTSALLRYAVPLETPDGPQFEERYWSAVHTPVFDDAGKLIFVAQNAIDVTDLYCFDANSHKYVLKRQANSAADVPPMNHPQMHEAMTRILNDERSQLQSLFDQAPGFIAVLNSPALRFEMANAAFYALVGQRDLIGKRLIEALPELAGQGHQEMLDNAFISGVPVVLRGCKMSLQRSPEAALEDRFVDLLYQPIRGHDERVTGVFVQGSDVTLAHRTSDALSEKMLQLEEIRSSQSFLLELADTIRPLGNPDLVTDAACQMLGHKLHAARALYADVDDASGAFYIRRDWTDDSLPSLVGKTGNLYEFGADLLESLRSGAPVINHDVKRDARTALHAAAYDAIGVRATLLLPLVKEGKLQAVLTIQAAQPCIWCEQDLYLAQQTAERTWSAVDAAQAQAQLRAERDQSQYIFNSMAEGFAVLDREWKILSMNAEGLRLTQRSAADVIGHDHWEIWPDLKGTDTETVYRRVMETGKTQVIEVLKTLPDHSRVWTEMRAHPAQDGGIAFFFRDVSARREAQEQLKIADQRKDEFLAMLAHELRNPLAPIGAAAQLLQFGQLDDTRVRKTSQIIGRQVDHMTHLINDLLDVSRVTRGLVVLETSMQEMAQVIAEAVEQVTPLMQARRHHFAMHLPEHATYVMGDRMRLVQIFTNILNNAAKYTDEGGTITLTCAVQGDALAVTIADNGVGMAPDLVAHAFDLFAQAERTSDRSAGGLGLGLALVRSLVELHHGSVTCDSAGPGCGSAFTVRLVRAVEASPAADQVAPLRAPARNAGALRILIVDDNEDAAAMLGLLLEAAGHEVLVEHTARAGLVQAQATAPDVCLLDIGLPDMDGTALAVQLRAHPATAGACMIAVTGYGQESDRQRTHDAGFDHHMVKPLDSAALFAVLASRLPQSSHSG